MSNRFYVAFASIALLAGGLPALAHHAFSNEFDESKPLTLEGVVTRVDWENPHVHYFIDVTQADGTVVNWACETGGPNRLTKRGWMRDSLKPGDKVIVHAFPAKDASHSADGRKVTLANGQTIGEEPKQ
ncbi:MAG TPA: DUF6152 family protein [Bryobacteraceae bacterium]|jgi:hypothetical protein|nr:DUF6152 family protein [Bryobacteraceae bacterium]